MNGGKARIILEALATPGEVPEERPALDLIWQARARRRLRPRQATGDRASGTLAIIRALEDQGVRAYLLVPDRPHHDRALSKDAFCYDPERDHYTCPNGAVLPLIGANLVRGQRRYRAPAPVCNACPRKPQCTASDRGRTVTRRDDEAYSERVRAHHRTEA